MSSTRAHAGEQSSAKNLLKTGVSNIEQRRKASSKTSGTEAERRQPRGISSSFQHSLSQAINSGSAQHAVQADSSVVRALLPLKQKGNSGSGNGSISDMASITQPERMPYAFNGNMSKSVAQGRKAGPPSKSSPVDGSSKQQPMTIPTSIPQSHIRTTVGPISYLPPLEETRRRASLPRSSLPSTKVPSPGRSRHHSPNGQREMKNRNGAKVRSEHGSPNRHERPSSSHVRPEGPRPPPPSRASQSRSRGASSHRDSSLQVSSRRSSPTRVQPVQMGNAGPYPPLPAGQFHAALLPPRNLGGSSATVNNSDSYESMGSWKEHETDQQIQKWLDETGKSEERKQV
ncbi:hypothetical protein NA57DRAFT_70235 [Rhizodiscina lignyota]|uniref:Uncharacterized protein n=1 Tax=Rhizodiscina lignyota TaxID=1504668 RepID=A0A9P4MAT9_9PEZI|nr:hypothetical protein NA57DRAFT_70235 [Rhizodiscina lignyota]